MCCPGAACLGAQAWHGFPGLQHLRKWPGAGRAGGGHRKEVMLRGRGPGSLGLRVLASTMELRGVLGSRKGRELLISSVQSHSQEAVPKVPHHLQEWGTAKCFIRGQNRKRNFQGTIC